MTTIFCDEAGNSGAHLLDSKQPFFVLASNDFTTAEAQGLIEHVRSAQAAEPKFTSLRRSNAGIARLARFMADERLTKKRVAVSFSHKPFMVVAKMVDIIVETLFHMTGRDLYVGGRNQGLSNLLHYCLPTYCGEENTRQFLQAFVDLVRGREEEQREAFYAAGARMLRECGNENLIEHLTPLVEPKLFPYWFGDNIDSYALDPAIPALFSHIIEWARRTPDRFDIVHDDSKPILATQATFESMMAQANEQSEIIGYDRRKFSFPLRAQSLSQADSRLHPQLQVADLCAGLINHLVKCREADALDALAEKTEEFGATEWVFDGLIPSLAITPQELGTEEAGGINSVDAMLSHLASQDGRNGKA